MRESEANQAEWEWAHGPKSNPHFRDRQFWWARIRPYLHGKSRRGGPKRVFPANEGTKNLKCTLCGHKLEDEWAVYVIFRGIKYLLSGKTVFGMRLCTDIEVCDFRISVQSGVESNGL